MTPIPRVLAPFAAEVRPWLVLARNGVLVVGVLLLGWSASLAVFVIWFDGITALATTAAGAMRGMVRNDPSMRGYFVVGWSIITGLFGIPYWFLFVVLATTQFEEAFWGKLLIDDGALWLIASVFASNAIETMLRGFHRMTDREIRREFDWDVHMHMVRVATILLVTVLAFHINALAVGIALALSYVEIYPLRALRFFGGDQTLDADNIRRAGDVEPPL